MKLSNEVIEKICGMDHLSGKERKEKLQLCEKIAQQVDRVQGLIAKAKEDHEKSIKKLANNLTDIRIVCNHDFTKHYADPSGGSDSFDECLICGVETGKSKPKGSDRP